jgi:hypothetical protein
MFTNSQTRLPDAFASRSHNAQSNALRAAPAGKSSCRPRQIQILFAFDGFDLCQHRGNALIVPRERNAFAATDVFAIGDRHNDDSRLSSTTT